MISWIVATHRPDLLKANLLATLDMSEDDELILVEDAGSITAAYTEGQSRAQYPIKCYIHSDVQVLDTHRLRSELIVHTPGAGLVGVIGSRELIIPWWNGSLMGSVQDSRLGTLDFGPGGPCDLLDGLLLATTKHVNWDLTWPGWHGYDYDSCTQMVHAGRQNFCLTGGRYLVKHNSDSPQNLDAIEGWHDSVAEYQKKWSGVPIPSRA